MDSVRRHSLNVEFVDESGRRWLGGPSRFSSPGGLDPAAQVHRFRPANRDWRNVGSGRFFARTGTLAL